MNINESKIFNLMKLIKGLNFSKIIYEILIKLGLSKTSNIALYINYKFKSYPKKQIFFFHISKCAGTALRDTFKEISFNSENKILRFGHAVKARHVNFMNKNRYLINIREPLDRFLSAFYDRKKSKNLIDPVEINCFEIFPDANLLGEALNSNDEKFMNKAKFALRKIALVNHRYKDWFDIKFLKTHQPFFIFEQENIQQDFKIFCKKINYEEKVTLEIVNKNQIYPEKTVLTELSKKNLKLFFKEDFIIYNYLLKIKDFINNPNN